MCLNAANEMLKASVCYDEAGNWRESKFVAEEAAQPLERARYRLAQLAQLSQQPASSAAAVAAVAAVASEAAVMLEEYESSRLSALSRARVQQHLSVGDSMMASLLLDEERLSVDQAWAVADEYRQAMLLGRENHVEGEAEAASKLGTLYDKVLKLREHAKRLHKHALTLAHTITVDTGKLFCGSSGWYADSSAALKWYQQVAWEVDQKMLGTQRMNIMKKLKPELDAIALAMNGEGCSVRGGGVSSKSVALQIFDLLSHIQSHHPPLEAVPGSSTSSGSSAESIAALKARLELLEADKYEREHQQKALLYASRCYHPDKNKDMASGVEWYVMCEEIQKHINGRMSDLKLRS
jgi:hypothetical protein